MPIRVECHCGKKYLLKDSVAGRRVQCPACAAVIRVPGGAPEMAHASGSGPVSCQGAVERAALPRAAMVLAAVAYVIVMLLLTASAMPYWSFSSHGGPETMRLRFISAWSDKGGERAFTDATGSFTQTWRQHEAFELWFLEWLGVWAVFGGMIRLVESRRGARHARALRPPRLWAALVLSVLWPGLGFAYAVRGSRGFLAAAACPFALAAALVVLGPWWIHLFGFPEAAGMVLFLLAAAGIYLGGIAVPAILCVRERSALGHQTGAASAR